MANMLKLSKEDARMIIACFDIKKLTEPVWYKGRIVREGINHKGLEEWTRTKAARLMSRLSEYSEDERMTELKEYSYKEELRVKYNKEMKKAGHSKHDVSVFCSMLKA